MSEPRWSRVGRPLGVTALSAVAHVAAVAAAVPWLVAPVAPPEAEPEQVRMVELAGPPPTAAREPSRAPAAPAEPSPMTAAPRTRRDPPARRPATTGP
ncbi:MAG TPA: hypothetical protein RMH99_21500, partial [Sandaracinaceae bacterium LLY-WYZ-13_1]|nr:hypothetical protein [Sandaracinaceae bacterium LLY-WYZ-13_1]